MPSWFEHFRMMAACALLEERLHSAISTVGFDYRLSAYNPFPLRYVLTRPVEMSADPFDDGGGRVLPYLQKERRYTESTAVSHPPIAL